MSKDPTDRKTTSIDLHHSVRVIFNDAIISDLFFARCQDIPEVVTLAGAKDFHDEYVKRNKNSKNSYNF